jgi:glycosyltransferase involved in cell wall biosynthesis
MEQAKVSVIVPAYNAGKTLKGTLQSVLKQTYGNLEIIVVDDGSEEPVEPLIDELNDDRILYYRTVRSNANVARNYGILKSSGDYIAMLDADDRWLENHIEDCLKTLKDNNADGVYGGLYFCRDQSYSKDMRQILYARNLNPDESMIDYLLTTRKSRPL